MKETFSIAAVVFDMDGLLLDSEATSREVLFKTAQIQGVELSQKIALQMVGRSTPSSNQLIADLLGSESAAHEFIALRDRLYEEEFEAGRIPLKRGVLDVLQTLDEFKIPRAIATSTRRHIAIRKLSKVNIVNRFDYIVGGDEVTNGKPAPDIYLKATSLLGKSPEHCLACEDSPPGIEAAFTAGLRPILVPDLITPTERMIGHAWRVVPDLVEVSAIIRGALTATIAA
jgi:HAD superfamily hydrolase (TIGR01509 family)